MEIEYKTRKEIEEQYKQYHVSNSVSYQTPKIDYDTRIRQNRQGEKYIYHLLPEWILSLEAMLRKIYNRKKARELYNN